MESGKLVFAQLMDFVPRHDFEPAFGGMKAIVVHVASRAGINFSAWRLHN